MSNKEDDENEYLSKLFVGGLSQATTEEMVKKHFETYGALSEVKILYDKATTKSRYVYTYILIYLYFSLCLFI